MKKKAHLANATTGTLRLLKPICGRAWVEKRVPRDSDVSEKQACKMKCDSGRRESDDRARREGDEREIDDDDAEDRAARVLHRGRGDGMRGGVRARAGAV